ncbi:MAG: hypothetical protein O3B01_32320 [Planctomycetota bacterium]|nr:hypothetical protein [Planctomycetota bacterium]MDA1143268.1 hypothetical protein [Planctomycetota bacterium]
MSIGIGPAAINNANIAQNAAAAGTGDATSSPTTIITEEFFVLTNQDAGARIENANGEGISQARGRGEGDATATTGGGSSGNSTAVANGNGDAVAIVPDGASGNALATSDGGGNANAAAGTLAQAAAVANSEGNATAVASAEGTALAMSSSLGNANALSAPGGGNALAVSEDIGDATALSQNGGNATALARGQGDVSASIAAGAGEKGNITVIGLSSADTRGAQVAASPSFFVLINQSGREVDVTNHFPGVARVEISDTGLFLVTVDGQANAYGPDTGAINFEIGADGVLTNATALV